MFDGVWRDGVAIRSLRATPIVTTVASLSLAPAIGANTAIFSIVNALLLRPLPVRDPEQLVLITDGSTAPHVRVWDYQMWEQVRQQRRLFESSAAWSLSRFNPTMGGEARFVDHQPPTT